MTTDGPGIAFEFPIESQEITIGQYEKWTGFDIDLSSGSLEYVRSRIATIIQGEWSQIPASLSGDETLPGGYLLQFGDPVSLWRLYMHFNTILLKAMKAKLQPENRNGMQIRYQGNTYFVVPETCQSITSYKFSREMLARVMWKPGEVKPANLRDRQTWLKKKANHLSELPLIHALQIYHFCMYLNAEIHHASCASLKKQGLDEASIDSSLN